MIALAIQLPTRALPRPVPASNALLFDVIARLRAQGQGGRGSSEEARFFEISHNGRCSLRFASRAPARLRLNFPKEAELLDVMRTIRAEAAETFLIEQIRVHREGIASALAPFDPRDAALIWLDTIRAIEEFINLPLFGLDDESLESAIVGFRLNAFDPRSLVPIRSALLEKFGEGVAQRFVWTALQGAAIGAAFRMHGLLEAAGGFETVGAAIGYFQSHRRHLVALLYTLPAACRGVRSVPRLDSLNEFLPRVEHSGLELTGLHRQLMLAKVFPDYELRLDAHGFVSNHQLSPSTSHSPQPNALLTSNTEGIGPEMHGSCA